MNDYTSRGGRIGNNDNNKGNNDNNDKCGIITKGLVGGLENGT